VNLAGKAISKTNTRLISYFCLKSFFLFDSVTQNSAVIRKSVRAVKSRYPGSFVFEQEKNRRGIKNHVKMANRLRSDRFLNIFQINHPRGK
jgi:hypothetical protein